MKHWISNLHLRLLRREGEGDDMPGFTEEELSLAKSVDLTAVAANLGYTVKRVGNYHTLKEMDSIRIYHRTNWFRWSKQYEKGENGGSQVDFLRVFAGMEIKEAVFWLLDFAGYKRMEGAVQSVAIKHLTKREPEAKKQFILPAPAANNSYLFAYLYGQRAISKQVIQYFVDRNMIYEARAYHNIVFKGNDKDGNTKFASMRGVFDRNGKGFKCDVAGNDKNYGFNVVHDDCQELFVFEAAIDLISYMDIFNDFESNMLALGMLSDAPLMTFLKEHPGIKRICFCFDNDEPGRKAAKELKLKYEKLSYEVMDCPPPEPYKDYNQWLVATKKSLQRIEVEKKCAEKVH